MAFRQQSGFRVRTAKLTGGTINPSGQKATFPSAGSPNRSNNGLIKTNLRVRRQPSPPVTGMPVQ